VKVSQGETSMTARYCWKVWSAFW